MSLLSVNLAVEQAIAALKDDLFELSSTVHAAAEIGFAEYESVRAVVELLTRNGVTVEQPFGHLETAFRASVGKDNGPVIAIFAEYDALPGIGHGCGHNLICGAAVGAFLGLSAIADQLAGRVLLIGCPAEENGSAKELLARVGALDGIDAALMVHPIVGEGFAESTSIGLRSVEVSYHGVAAHASSDPHLGRNALDAVVFAYQGVAALRQHILPANRIHGVILEGGQVANVVPELARARFVLRAESLDELVELSRRLQGILEGAALITETRLDAVWDQVPPNLPLRSNAALAEVFGRHYRNAGQPIRDAGHMLGSTDMGNVSLRLPSIHPALSVVAGDIAMHTREFAASAKTSQAHRAMIDGAVAMAQTTLEYFELPELREAVQTEFTTTGGAVNVAAALEPPDARRRPANTSDQEES